MMNTKYTRAFWVVSLWLGLELAAQAQVTTLVNAWNRFRAAVHGIGGNENARRRLLQLGGGTSAYTAHCAGAPTNSLSVVASQCSSKYDQMKSALEANDGGQRLAAIVLTSETSIAEWERHASAWNSGSACFAQVTQVNACIAGLKGFRAAWAGCENQAGARSGGATRSCLAELRAHHRAPPVPASPLSTMPPPPAAEENKGG